MFLLIDNYDSFTYNLVQAFSKLGREPLVLRNDDPRLLELAEEPSLSMVCISPGPGRPEDAGLCLEFLTSMSVTVFGIIKLFNLQQSANAFSAMWVTRGGIVILLKLIQSLNAMPPI